MKKAIFRVFVMFTLILSMSTPLTTPANALIPVFDGAGLSQQLIAYINMIRQYVVQAQQYSTQLQQYYNQVQQLQNEAKNLTNFNYVVNLAGLSDLQKIMQQAQGIANDYATLQRKFDTLYPNFAKLSAMNGDAYAQQANAWSNETSNNIRDELNLYSMMRNNYQDDTQSLTNLTIRASNIQGAKDGLQSIAQIASLQTKQLMQLQQVMAASARAEGAYLQEKVHKEIAARARSQHLYDGWTDKGPRVVNPTIEKLH